MADEQTDTLDIQAVQSEEDPTEGPLSANDRRIVRLVQQSFSHSGPLPAPETLSGYEAILPGAAERILVMAEKQSEHRQNLEKAVVLSGIKSESRGAFFAFALGFSGIISAALLSWHGQSLLGFATFIGSLGSLVAVFIFARTDQRKERREKASSDD